MKIHISASNDHSFTPHELKNYLEQLPMWNEEIKLEINYDKPAYVRAIDPSVLTATIALTGTALGALISGLLQVVQENYKEKIILITKSGLHLEIEARNAQEKVPELIKLLRSMEIELIEV